ncbi:MAG: hypothetical protein ACRY3E_04645 [Candidatus Lariskella arthropodorum]
MLSRVLKFMTKRNVKGIESLQFSSEREMASKGVLLSAGKDVLCYLGIAGVVCTCAMITSSAYAAESAVQVASIEKLGATIKKILVSDGKLMIDAGIIAAGGYAAVITKSPIALILSIVSAFIFHIAIAVFVS